MTLSLPVVRFVVGLVFFGSFFLAQPAFAAISVSCSPSVSSAQTGQSVTWTASASGGNGSFTYSWTGSQSLTGTSASVSKTYTRASGYTSYTAAPYPNPYVASVTVTSGAESTTVSCGSVVVRARTDEVVHAGNDNAPYPAAQWAVDDDRCFSYGATTGGPYRNSIVCRGGFGGLLRPDITAGTASFTAQSGSPYVWVGQPFTYSASITNSGAAAASNFPNILNIVEASAVVAATPATMTLTASASQTASASYTFTTPGTYTARFCGDTNTSWTGVATESNEGNNCGATVSLSVAPAVPTGATATCNGDGTSATLSWTATPNASAYFIRASKLVSQSCPSGWQTAAWDTALCIPNPDWVTGTSVSYAVTPGQSYTWWLHSSNSSGAWSPAVSSSFTCTAQVDLTATTGSNTSGITSANVTLGGTVQNPSTATVGGSFPNLVQVCNNTSCSSYNQRYATQSAGPLAPSGSASVSASVTLPSSAGTYYYRTCADSTTSWVGSITETNESNNCGSWSTLTVSAPTPTATLNASPLSVVSGSSSTLSWSSTNATSCTGSGFSTGGATSGSVSTGALSSNTNYQVTCSGPGGSASDLRTVTVYLPTVSISVSPDRIASGSTSSVTWTSNLCTSVSVTKNGAAFSSSPTGTAVSSGVISRQTTFTISCDSGLVSASAVVNLVPAFEEF